jgi:hypothetical protein
MEQLKPGALVASAFVKAKRNFGSAIKNKANPHFKSLYADLSACLEAVDDALLNHGIALIQETFEDSTGVTVETVFLHESGESLRCGKLHVPASKQDPQGYGSALSYCRRYSLLAACGIAQEDDDGQAASKAAGQQPRQAHPELLAAEQIATITSLADEVGVKMQTICAFAKVEKLEDAPISAYHPIIKKLEEKRKAA